MDPETPQVHKEITEAPSAPATASQKRTQIAVIGGAVLLLALLVAAIVLMAQHPNATTVVRDIAIVFVAVETFLIGMALLVLIVEIQTLIKVLREEIQPMLRSVNDTAATVRGTTEFMSENLVSPVIKAVSFTAGVRQVLGDLFGVVTASRPHSKSGPHHPTHSQ
ncbi:MAG TPA: hypothetical protein PLM06_12295 [Anaerolineae bacterium]|nr:hypothetical protein [Anaerolineae bacterium]